MSKLIFMLTYHDRTVQNAMEVFDEIKDTSIQNVGFKDVGLPFEKLRELANAIKEAGMNSFIEIVSETEELNLAAARKAVEMGVMNIIGVRGEYAKPVSDMLKGTGVKFFPYVGRVTGIPEVLTGSIVEIVQEARKMEVLGADGINLLAYRYKGDVDRLMTAVVNAVKIKVLVAGSIDSFERIVKVVGKGASLYTIGSAIFDRKFVPGGSIRDQIAAILRHEEKIKP